MKSSCCITRVLAVLALALLTAAPLVAANLDLPAGKWWENERLAQRLNLTADQRSQIRSLVYQHALRMVDLSAAVKRAELEMANQVQQPEFAPEAVRAAFAAFQKARMALERERFEMLLAVRGVLSAEQWQQIQDLQHELRRRREVGSERRAPRGAPRDPATPGAPSGAPGTR